MDTGRSGTVHLISVDWRPGMFSFDLSWLKNKFIKDETCGEVPKIGTLTALLIWNIEFYLLLLWNTLRLPIVLVFWHGPEQIWISMLTHNVLDLYVYVSAAITFLKKNRFFSQHCEGRT